MKPLRDRETPQDHREPRFRARRGARAFEAFMSEQALALHRTVSATRRAVMAARPAPVRDPATPHA